VPSLRLRKQAHFKLDRLIGNLGPNPAASFSIEAHKAVAFHCLKCAREIGNGSTRTFRQLLQRNWVRARNQREQFPITVGNNAAKAFGRCEPNLGIVRGGL